MVNLLSFIGSFFLTILLYFILFQSIERDLIVDLNIEESIEINFEDIATQIEKHIVSKNTQEEIPVGDELSDLFEDSEYKPVEKKIQRYDINKITKVDNTKSTSFNELFKDEKKEDSVENNKFSIKKQYYQPNQKITDDKNKKYLLIIHKELSKIWKTKPEDGGKKAKILFNITNTGNFTYRVVQVLGDQDFKNRLIASLEDLKLRGFEPPNEYITVTVNFIAKE
ncbi:MAG: hypothetical protein OIF32_05330 [Campylobacterales bacterium]|nr:hypothetical protein [Campylobacterales bacterium]